MCSAWEDHKETIRGYWIDDNKRLEEVVHIMKVKYNFDKTKKAYETKFSRWGVEFKKKRDAIHWVVLGSKIQRRDRLKKKSHVMINGKIIPEDKLRKEISRHYFPSHEERYGQVPDPRTPEGVSVFTPYSLPDLSCISIGLPWLRFQTELMAITNGDSHFGTIGSIIRGNMDAMLLSSALAILPNLLPKETRMRAMLPVSILEIRGPALGEAAMSMLYYFNMMMYLISNDMLPISETLLNLLEIALTRGTFLSLLHMGTLTTRAFIQKLFLGAIRHENSIIPSVMLDAGVVLNAWGNDNSYPLYLAIKKRDTALAKRLIREGVNLKCYSGSKALGRAIDHDDSELVSLLIERGADVNARGPWLSRTMLEMAVYRDNTEIAQLLLDAGAYTDPRDTSKKSDPIIHAATERGIIQMVRLLLKAEADMNAISEYSCHNSPLVIASQSGNLQLAQLLIDCGAQIDSCGRHKRNALTIAAKKDNMDLARVLINAGTAVNTPLWDPVPHQRSCGTALYEAVKRSHFSMVELLLKYKADPNISAYILTDSRTIRETALYAAVKNGDWQIAQLLLWAGAKVNEISSDLNCFEEPLETTALYRAMKNCDYTLVKVLLSAGASVSYSVLCCRTDEERRYKDGRLSNTMETAIQNNNTEIIRLLLGSDPSTVIESGAYFLHKAINSKDIELIQSLINAGVDLNQAPIGQRSETALQAAVSTGDVHLTRFLIYSGAYVNFPARGDHGRTALQSAAEKGNTEMVEVLLQHGADVHAPGSIEYGNALQIAAEGGHTQVIEQLFHAIATSGPRGGLSREHVGVSTVLDDWKSAMLPAAARGGLTSVVELLLAEGANVDVVLPNTQYRTALQEAVDRLDLEMVQLLLSFRANPNIPGPVWVESLGKWQTGTPLQVAVEKESMELIRILIRAGARPDVLTAEYENKRTPLEAAMAKQDKRGMRSMIVQLLLAAGADVNMIGTYCGRHKYVGLGKIEGTALVAAINHRDVQLVQVLLRAGADVNARSDFGSVYRISPLEIAVALSDLETVKLLLNEGADTEVDSIFRCSTHYYSGSMLTMAILGDNMELFYLLLSAGAKIDTAAHTGKKLTTLQAATLKGYTDVVETLIERGVEVNEIGGDVWGTALEVAAEEGYVGIAYILLKAGADPNLGAPDGGRTPLAAATEYDRIDMVRMLLNATSARGITGRAYIELLDSALAGALEGAEKYKREVANSALEMIRGEIRNLEEA